MKIVIFGDSIAKGLNLSKDDLSIKRLNFGFASLLEKEYDVTNHSMFGQTLKRASDKKLFERRQRKLVSLSRKLQQHFEQMCCRSKCNTH